VIFSNFFAYGNCTLSSFYLFIFSFNMKRLHANGFLPILWSSKKLQSSPPKKAKCGYIPNIFLKWKKLRIYLYSWLSILKCIIKTWGFEGKKDFKTWQMWAFFHEFNLMYRLKTYFPRWKFAKICNKSIHPSDVLIQIVLWHSQSNHHP
jgi:hypothetical protein